MPVLRIFVHVNCSGVTRLADRIALERVCEPQPQPVRPADQPVTPEPAASPGQGASGWVRAGVIVASELDPQIRNCIY